MHAFSFLLYLSLIKIFSMNYRSKKNKQIASMKRNIFNDPQTNNTFIDNLHSKTCEVTVNVMCCRKSIPVGALPHQIQLSTLRKQPLWRLWLVFQNNWIETSIKIRLIGREISWSNLKSGTWEDSLIIVRKRSKKITNEIFRARIMSARKIITFVQFWDFAFNIETWKYFGSIITIIVVFIEVYN